MNAIYVEETREDRRAKQLTIASQCDLTPFAPLFPTSSSPFNSAHRFDLTILSIASKNFCSSEFDQVFFGEEVVGKVGSESDLTFLGVVGAESDGR
jgi:hypothetical protein